MRCSTTPRAPRRREMFALPSRTRRRRRSPGRSSLGDGRDGEIHLADPGQGAEEADPPRDRAHAPGRVGREDRLVPVVLRGRVRAPAAEREAEIVDGAGHAPQLERPDAVARLVRDFLSR